MPTLTFSVIFNAFNELFFCMYLRLWQFLVLHGRCSPLCVLCLMCCFSLRWRWLLRWWWLLSCWLSLVSIIPNTWTECKFTKCAGLLSYCYFFFSSLHQFQWFFDIASDFGGGWEQPSSSSSYPCTQSSTPARGRQPASHTLFSIILYTLKDLVSTFHLVQILSLYSHINLQWGRY